MQDEDVIPGAGEINVTCYFAVGSKALGCHVLINSTTGRVRGNIMRGNTTDGAPMNATGVFPGLEVGMYDVRLFDIEYDGNISETTVAQNRRVEITKPPPPTDITEEPTSSSSTTDEGPTDAISSTTTTGMYINLLPGNHW